MEIRKVGIIGAGQMGSGIAQVCLQSGYPVTMQDIADQFVEKGLNTVKSGLARNVEKGRMTKEQHDAAVARLKGTTSAADLKDSDIVIEAAVEDIEIKKKIFANLDQVCPPHTILASNTSSLPIIKMAAATKRQDRVIGTHFFNPVPVLNVVEVSRTVATSDETVQKTKKFIESLGKTVVLCQDLPGFIANRAMTPYLIESIRLLESGVSTAEDIDNACRLGYNLPMGPLQVVDLIGLDTVYSIANILFDEFKDPKFAPPPLLARMVMAGRLGRKTGRGFYNYTK